MENENKKQIAAVIIPTFNEAGNIEGLLEEIIHTSLTLPKKWQLKVVVVDGCSNDGTAEIIERMSGKNKGLIHLIKESEKNGIGAAYCLGFKYAIDMIKSDVVIEFDGDFQHPPATIVQLLTEIDNGYDYIVASRNTEGGSEPAGRSIFRSALTNVGGFVARIILFFPSIKFWRISDPTTGLKATRTKGFADRLELSPSKLKSKKFGYKIQWLYETSMLDARYKEIPLKFSNRRAGESKFSWPVIADILKVCVMMRANDPSTRRFLKFAIVGFSGYVVNTVLLEIIFRATHIEILSWVLSAEAAILSNFFFNNIWTFGDRRMTGFADWLSGLGKFNLTSLGTIFIEGVFGPLITLLVGDSYRQFVLVFVIIFMVLPYNWLVYNRFIWKKSAK